MTLLAAFKLRLQNFFNLLFLENFRIILSLLILAVAGSLAYRNAFSGPFIFDDLTQIVQNPKIFSWQWPWTFIENNRRPFLYTSLAFNYHFDGFNSFGYHVFNIRVHILASMMMFLLVRKTLLLPIINQDLRREADLLSLSSALIWLLHPIHTQAVTYIIQRAESLMGLLFITSLYCSVRFFTSRKTFWLIAAGVVAIFAGLTKEVTLVLPLIILFYDVTFISLGIHKALKNNRWLYWALSLTWVVMIFLYLTTKSEEKLTAGFGMEGMSPLLYLVNQPAVILHYLRLSFWPDPLVFDYQWPAINRLHVLLPSLAIVGTWVIVLVVMYRRSPKVIFVLLSSLILLLPSSSFIPLKDLIFEYRLYLSLACGSVFFVLLLRFLVGKLVHIRNQKIVIYTFVALVSLVLGGLTNQRNKVYQSEEKIWLDVIRKQPMNARAYNNLGEFWLRQGHVLQAQDCFLKSLALDTKYADVYANMTTVLGKLGKLEEALKYAKQAVSISPDFAIGYNNLGSVLSQMGRFSEAVPYFEKTLALGFIREGVFVNLASALNNSGQKKKTRIALEEGLKFFPESAELSEFLKEIAGLN